MTKPFDRFWMVKGAGPTSATNASFAEAEKEAIRLASKEWRDIHILEAVAVVRPVARPTVTLKFSEDGE